MRRIRFYHAAVFLSAFLLFQIQPMTSKALLPGFGGSYLVWAGCMVFYQGMLLAGYIYAHLVQRWFGVARYARLHWMILIVATAFFPFQWERLSSGAGTGPPAVAVFAFLFAAVSLPFFVLSTTSLILQKWLSVSDLPERGNPYVLYGASNLGSMLALVTYPVLIEPFMGLEMQGWVWWGGYAVLMMLHVPCAVKGSGNEPWSAAGLRRTEDAAENAASPAPVAAEARRSPGWGVWFLLSLASCFALLAVTNVITFDVASVPFFWVLPLAVYLASFVVTFKRRVWCPASAKNFLYWAVAIGMVLHLVTQLHLGVPAVLSLLAHLVILFVLCWNCAGMLARSKPGDPRDLTTFYVVIALGGLAGSMLVGWVVPAVSSSLVEYPVALVMVVAAMAVGRGSARPRPPGEVEGEPVVSRNGLTGVIACTGVAVAAVVLLPWAARRVWDDPNTNVLLPFMAFPVMLAIRRMAGKPLECAAVLLAATIGMHWTEDLAMGAGGVKRLRNFYGVYKVFDKDGLRYLQHGTTQHGRQYLSGPKRETPLGYYHPTTPAAEVLESDEFSFREIGMIGLGTGALTCYAGSNQVFTVYELDPDNLVVARENFSYLDIAERRGVDFRFVPGDGRLSIRSRTRSQSTRRPLDLLIVDAFNSGSIPVHLLTVEALEDYAAALDADGILLIHVSNKILELRPVLESNAAAAGLTACHRDNAGRTDPDAEETYWMAFSRDVGVIEALTDRLGWRMRRGPAALQGEAPRPWTDRYSGLLGAIRWGE